MGAATGPVNLKRAGNTPVKMAGAFVKTSTTFKKGWALARDAAGLFVVPTEITTLLPGGFATKDLVDEEIPAADDTTLVNVECALYSVPMLSTSTFAASDKPGPIYFVNNFEFAKSGLSRSIAGLFLWLDDSDAARCIAWIGPEGAAIARAIDASTSGGEEPASVALTDATQTIQPAAGFLRHMAAATLTANRTITIGTTGAAAGDVLRITRRDVTGYTMTIVNGGVGAGTLAILPGGEVGDVAVQFDGTNWALREAGTLAEELVVGAALTDAAATITRGGRRSLRTLEAATLTAARTLTLGTTGAQVGDVIRVDRLDLTGFAYTIANGGGGAGTLAVLPGGVAAFAEAYFDGTNWIFLGAATLEADTVAGAALTDASATITRGGRVSWRSLAAATLTQARTLTLGTTNATLGDLIIVTVTGAQGFAYTITNGGGGGGNPMVIPPGTQGAGVFYFDGTNWLYQWGASLETDWVAGAALTDTASTTVQRAAKRTSFLLAGTMSQGETITLGTTGALVGDYIKIIRTSTSAETAAIVNGGGGGGTLVTLPASKVNFATARFDGTDWLFDECGTQ